MTSRQLPACRTLRFADPARLAACQVLDRAPVAADLGEGVLVWEARDRSDLEAPGGTLLVSCCLMFDRTLEPEATTHDVRRLDESSEGRAVWGAFVDGELASSLTLAHDAREARLQGVETRPEHRRKGLCSALLNAAIRAYQEESFGIVYAVAAEDSDAYRVFRRLGFRGVTWFHELQLP